MGILGLLSVLTGCTQYVKCEQEVAGLGISYLFKPGAREWGKGVQYFFFHFLLSLSFFKIKFLLRNSHQNYGFLNIYFYFFLKKYLFILCINV